MALKGQEIDVRSFPTSMMHLFFFKLICNMRFLFVPELCKCVGLVGTMQ